MNKLIKCIGAGVVATAVVAGLLFLKHHLGFMPDVVPPFDAKAMIFGQAIPIWFVQVVFGIIIWPFIFTLVQHFFNASYWLKGAMFAVFAWALMPTVIAPVIGHAVLADKTALTLIGLLRLSLVIYIIYGAVLGLVYSRIKK